MDDISVEHVAAAAGVVPQTMEDALLGRSSAVTALRHKGYGRILGVAVLGFGTGVLIGFGGGLPAGIICGFLGSIIPHFTPWGVWPIFREIDQTTRADVQEFCERDSSTGSKQDSESVFSVVPEYNGVANDAADGLKGTVAGMVKIWMAEYKAESDTDCRREILRLLGIALQAFKEKDVNEAFALAKREINDSSISDARKAIFSVLVDECAERQNVTVAKVVEQGGFFSRLWCRIRNFTN
ncbi:MAG: hypothetical protein LBI34_02885 [Puniceicoccales bacterium]|jgi:hypothetical protein|nr:hypothetical protein [Puniceicoccales bacterium]